MKTEENIKKKGKRNVSVLTVFIWLALIAVMTVITVSGTKEDNASRNASAANITTIKLKIEGKTEEELENEYENYDFWIFSGIDGDNVYYENNYKYTTKESEYYIYTSVNADEILDGNLNLTIDAWKDYENEYDCYIEYEINGQKYTAMEGGYAYIENIDFSADEELIIYATCKFVKKTEQGITKSSKWINKEQGLAQIKLQYIPVLSESKYKGVEREIVPVGKQILYAVILSEDFELSSEYATNNEWSILESINDFSELEKEIIDENGVSTGKKYVYVKSENVLFWYIYKIDFSTASNIDTFEFNVKYKGIDEEKISNEVLEISLKAGANINILPGGKNYVILISSSKLEYIRKREAIIKINKEVKGEKGNKIHYVGLFTDDISNKTDKITKIDAVDGKGSGTIEIAEYNLEDKYYVYEVDEKGNKISDEKLNYSRNNVIFEKDNSLSIRNITSNKEIISEYISTDMTGVDLGRGTGEENYVDNVLSIRDVYEDSITISSEKIKYKVTYEAGDGGIIEGKTEEQVYPEYYPQNIPTPKPNDGYKFVRWEVEKNGERIEVNPSEYEINEDTVFYAIFEKIPVETSVDTSDINVGGYVVITVVAIIVIASVIFFVVKDKKKSIK